jgi:hypothetical protein
MSENTTLSLVVAAAAGAFLYHIYAKTSVLEQAVMHGNGHAISLSSLLDMAASAEEDEDHKEPPVGFSTTQGKLRRKQNVRSVH